MSVMGIYSMSSGVYICISPRLLIYASSFSLGNHKFVYYVSESISVFLNKFNSFIFLDSTYKQHHMFVFLFLTYLT